MSALYSGVGERLTHYAVDLDGPLSKKAAVTLPADIQYAWPHPSTRYLYVASSNGGSRAAGDRHYASAFRIDATGALQPHGPPQGIVKS